jgi:hypothetical protein
VRGTTTRLSCRRPPSSRQGRWRFFFSRVRLSVPYFYRRQNFEYKTTTTRCKQRAQYELHELHTKASPKIATTEITTRHKKAYPKLNIRATSRSTPVTSEDHNFN